MNEHPVPTDEQAKVDALPSAQDTTTPQPPVAVKKRRSRPLLVTLLVLLVAALGGLATLLVYNYYMKPTPQATSAQQTVTVTKRPTADDILAAVKPVYTNSPATNQGLVVPIKVAGYDFYTQLDNNKVKAITGSVAYTDSAVDAAKIAKILKEKQFTEKISQPGTDQSDYLATYTSSDVACEVTVAKAVNNPTGNHQLAVACANMSDYTATASAQKPFFTVYTTKPSPTDSFMLFEGMPTVRQSKTAGYATAMANISGVGADGSTGLVGGFVGLYYQTPDKVWHFFTGAQNSLPCSAYNTPDLKKAYIGTECGDANGNTTTLSS